MRKLLFLLGFLIVLGIPTSWAHSPIPSLSEWTILVYGNGKNNLEEYIFNNVNEMERIGSSPSVNVLVELGSYSKKSVVRMRVEKDHDLKVIHSPVLMNLGNSDMGDWRNVAKFVEWGAKNYPAKRYFLIISDHGNGWHGSPMKDGSGQLVKDPKTGKPIVSKGVLSFDYHTKHAIGFHQLSLLADAVKKILGQNLDLFGAEGCLMAMMEVAAQFHGTTDVFIGSEALAWGEAWNYVDLLRELHQNSETSTYRMAELVIRSFLKTHRGDKTPVTLSAINVYGIPPVAEHVKKLSSIIQSLPPEGMEKLRQVIASTLNFKAGEDYGDLSDFMKGFSKMKVADPVWLQNFRNDLESLILLSTTTYPQGRARGVTLWFPRDRETLELFSPDYLNTRFNRNTNWLSALNALYGAK